MNKVEPVPQLSEVEKAVKKMTFGKAVGLDGVPGELIIDESPAYTLHANKKIWEKGEWPELWKSQGIVVTYKSGNSKGMPQLQARA